MTILDNVFLGIAIGDPNRTSIEAGQDGMLARRNDRYKKVLCENQEVREGTIGGGKRRLGRLAGNSRIWRCD